MLFSSDDDFPDIPLIDVGDAPASGQTQRLHALEEQFNKMKGSSALRHSTQEGLGTASARASEKSPPLATEDLMSLSTSGAPHGHIDPLFEVQREAILHELRQLVPHLSPQFTCSYRDALLLAGAVHNGGVASGDHQSLAEKCQALEAEKRQLYQRLERSNAQCEKLKSDVADSRQKLAASQLEFKNTNAILSQRREEARKQLLLEETRSEKLKVRNRKLEMENATLKERVHAHLR